MNECLTAPGLGYPTGMRVSGGLRTGSPNYVRRRRVGAMLQGRVTNWQALPLQDAADSVGLVQRGPLTNDGLIVVQ